MPNRLLSMIRHVAKANIKVKVKLGYIIVCSKAVFRGKFIQIPPTSLSNFAANRTPIFPHSLRVVFIK